MKRLRNIKKRISMTALMTGVVATVVLITLITVIVLFISMYTSTIEENARISGEQTVSQVVNTLSTYTEDMSDLIYLMEDKLYDSNIQWETFMDGIFESRTEVVAISMYSEEGERIEYWSDYSDVRNEINGSMAAFSEDDHQGIFISKPHVETMLINEYPWVVTIYKKMIAEPDNIAYMGLDIRFSEIANYVDGIGIGQRGYCFIIDTMGNIIYHPQQQLIYSGIKKENTQEILSFEDGSYLTSNVSYNIQTLENCNWRVVGVSYVDELITSKVDNMMRISGVILLLVLMTTVLIGLIFARAFSNPAKRLQKAMEEFEQKAETFQYKPIGGTREIQQLSNSFQNVVIRIQDLMNQVREEEITLRKTELNALQTQINPHFLYNTLDSIAWMCEEERTKEAVEMVNALAKLFRISISKGHELITIEKEVQHVQSYLHIQKVRYKNQFKSCLEVDTSCLSYLCNKITLQPIVENAIYHGLDRMVDEGLIRITICEMDTEIHMLIEDNGLGMTPEKCEEIITRDNSKHTGIGIKNVHDRIRIYFGEGYGVTITSELDKGTKVLIRMPKISEGDYYEKK